ncbi:MAG: hypothetical protein HY293_11220 [Planctomycetes bacterium]|nr:hypothetical protein [Planctomycetota bacterium]
MNRILSAGAVLLLLTAAAHPQEAASPKLPVKEITVFKDGHSLVLREGALPTDAAGHVVMEGLPVPVIGTFWPYSADPGAKLAAVVAGRSEMKVEKNALSLAEFLEANLGANVYITQANKETFTGTILAIPKRPAASLLHGLPEQPPAMLLLKTVEGMRTVPIAAIEHVTFRDKSETKITETESRASLTLRLDWANGAPAKTARVGMMYVQKGIRWIPGYRIELDGKGRAVVKLQATLLNELGDLENVTAHLVIGVPSFAFKDTPDPIALQGAIAQLSRYFDPESQTAHAFGNAIMSQSTRMGERRAAPAEAAPGEMKLREDGAKGDIFVFPVKGITLKKGECMVVPVAEYAVDVKDVYALDIPMAPPRDIRAEMGTAQEQELARLFNSPKVLHKIRLSNTGTAPFTTAPALILKGGQVLAQGLMTYTSPGGMVDIDLTTAVDLPVRKTELETKRTPNALRWNGDDYKRVDLEGKIAVTSYHPTAVEVEISRVVMGEVAPVGQGGRIEKVNQMEEFKGYPGYGRWWYHYWWWTDVNPVSRIVWKVTLEPGKSLEIPYSWHYFWR